MIKTKTVMTALTGLFALILVVYLTSLSAMSPAWFKALVGLGSEKNIPTLFQVGLFFWITLLAREAALQFEGKAAVFLYRFRSLFLVLMWDEWLSIHDTVLGYIGKLGPQLVDHHSWVVPASFLVIIGAIWALKGLVLLPRTLSLWMTVSAIVFVVGALGFEYLQGTAIAISKPIAILFEEGCEMAGLLTCIYALTQVVPLSIQVRITPVRVLCVMLILSDMLISLWLFN